MVNIPIRLLLFALLKNVKAANILAVLPIPSMNPQYMYTSLLKEISGHGHEITLVTANLVLIRHEELQNITIINLNNKLNAIWQKYNNKAISNKNRDVITEMTSTLSTTNYFCEALLQTDEMKKLMQEKHSYFDLLLLEASMIPLLSLSHVFKTPVILVSSTDAVLDNYETVGASTHPILYPSILQRRIYNLTILEKVVETSMYIRLKLKIVSSERKTDVKLKEHFGSDFPSLSELKRNVLALFLNSNPIWSGNRPVASNVVFLGGTQPKYKEQLSQDLQLYLEESRNGVIYVSFGSIIKPSQLSPENLLRILNVLSVMPYNILLKWDNDRLPGAPKNIKIYKWLPQSSLLGHPKVKLFITQGGIQSTFEAINAGVPLIGIPMYFDQWYNTEKYIHFNIGLQIDLASLTEEKLINAIRVVINNDSYRTAIADLRELMQDPHGSSMKRAIWWTEQVSSPYRIRHLHSPAANMTWTEYFELDFILFLLLIAFTTIIVFVVTVTLIIRYVCKSFEDIKKKIS